jgi:tetratricopeptide (TPR) repeat protein
MAKRLLFAAAIAGFVLGGCGGGGGDGGGPGPDTNPPIITSGPSASGVDYQGATVHWTTNETSTSMVKLGKTASYTDSLADGALVTSHSIVLSGLDQTTMYHYRVYSSDEAGNRVTSSDRTFTTTSPLAKFVAEGWDFFEEAEYDSSVARFEAAAAIDPDDVTVLEGLGWTYLYMYEFDACRSALLAALSVAPNRTDCLVAVTFLYQATEAYEDAISAGEYALQRTGSSYVFAHDAGVTDEDVRYSLILALAATGDFRGALEHAVVLDPGIDLDPDDPGTWGSHSTFEEAMIALIEDLRQQV